VDKPVRTLAVAQTRVSHLITAAAQSRVGAGVPSVARYVPRSDARIVQRHWLTAMRVLHFVEQRADRQRKLGRDLPGMHCRSVTPYVGLNSVEVAGSRLELFRADPAEDCSACSLSSGFGGGQAGQFAGGVGDGVDLVVVGGVGKSQQLGLHSSSQSAPRGWKTRCFS
jgi:hypothetical protein